MGHYWYRTATSLKEVVDYGTARRNRLSRPIKGKLDKHGEGAGERHAQTIVMQLPMYLLEEDGTFYHPLGKDGLPKDGKDDRPLVSLPRYRIKPEMQKEADRYVEAVMDFQAALLPGGQDAIHGGSLNLDEHRPHLQLLVDPFAANPRGKEPDALLNSFSYTFGRHPKDKINFPLRQKVDKRSRRPVFDKAGDPVMVAIGADGKMEMYHQRFKDYLVEKGFAIEAERDPVRHDRRVVGDMIDYGEAMDAAREAQEQSQTAMADLGAALETEDSAAGLMADLAAEIDVQKVELAAERRAADARAAEVIAEAERTLAAAKEKAAHAEANGYDAGLAAGVAEGREQGRTEGLAAVERERQAGYETGRAEGLSAGREEVAAEHTAARRAREQAQADAKKVAEALAEAERRRDAVPEYDPVAAVQAMEVARFDAGERLRIVQRDDNGAIVRDEANKPVMVKVNDELDREGARLYRGRSAGAGMTVGDRAKQFKGSLRGGQHEISKGAEQSKHRGQEGMSR
ncbi:hypothetical protein GCM10023217_25490 [Gordonia alkaliphila]|uniref:Uncharacterized protein n=1 Tax=Gordonia alkaliphila TaxID=1053547 RepID=A0ABP8ZD26_9ACTN